MRGVAAVAKRVDARVLGGDLTRSPRYLVDVCAIGTVERPVRRSGARPGDGLWVTGRLGGAGLGLARLRAGRGVADVVRRRFARPEPRIAAGRWLARRGARAMIDLSDGPPGDAGHPPPAPRGPGAPALRGIPARPGRAPPPAPRTGE